MPDIILTVVSGEPVDLGLSIPGVQGPIGPSTLPSGGVVGQVIKKNSSADYDAAWTYTVSGLTISASTLSGSTLAGTISGGTLGSPTINGAIVNTPTISGGSMYGSSLDAVSIDNSQIDDTTVTDTVIFTSTLVSPTISGVISTPSGVGLRVTSSGDSLSFFGASPVVCPSGIAIPSGGASTAEVLASLSGVIVALRDLGLIRA